MSKNEEGAERPALEFLAESLRFKAEHIEPDDPRPWAEMSDSERLYYRRLVHWVLLDRATVLRALDEGHGIRPTRTV